MNGFVNTGALYLLLFTLISTAPPTFLNHLHNRQILCHLVRHFLLQTYGGLASFVTHFFFGSRGVPFHLSMCFAFTRRVGGLRGTFATCFRVAADPFSRLCGTWCPCSCSVASRAVCAIRDARHCSARKAGLGTGSSRCRRPPEDLENMPSVLGGVLIIKRGRRHVHRLLATRRPCLPLIT